MNLVEQAWETTAPPALVDVDRWLVLPLNGGRALLKDMREGVTHSERTVRDAHVFVAAAKEAEAQRRARAAAATVQVSSYGVARAIVRALS